MLRGFTNLGIIYVDNRLFANDEDKNQTMGIRLEHRHNSVWGRGWTAQYNVAKTQRAFMITDMRTLIPALLCRIDIDPNTDSLILS